MGTSNSKDLLDILYNILWLGDNLASLLVTWFWFLILTAAAVAIVNSYRKSQVDIRDLRSSIVSYWPFHESLSFSLFDGM